MIKYLEKLDSFDDEIKFKCLVDFYADWCGPCKMVGKVLETMEKDIGINILKINTDKFPDLAAKFGIMSIPTIILMENGKEKSKHVGYMSEEEIKEFIK